MERNLRPLALIILDGWGINPKEDGNPISIARPPIYNSLLKEYPHTTLDASGESVGLPEGQMGNSEVGHMNIGAGRVVYQDLTRIDKAIREGEFFKNPVIIECIEKAKSASGRLHLMGLLSDGGVHSHIRHLFAIIEMAKKAGIRDLYIHAFLDGRDTPPQSGLGYVKSLQEYLKKAGIGQIATISGRYYAMDRDNRWDRVEKAYSALVYGVGVKASDPVEAVEKSYTEGVTDEFVVPIIITNETPHPHLNPLPEGEEISLPFKGRVRVGMGLFSHENGEPVATIKDGDGVIFFNFRADRARELTSALTSVEFDKFQRKLCPSLSAFASMKLYDEKTHLPAAYESAKLENIFSEVISKKNIKQFRTAETEKYAHVTYFFNGGEEKPFPGEDRTLIPSPKEVATYDQKPEMSAYKVTEELEKRIRSGEYGFILVNYANPDMVGHTGVLEAGIRAVEVVDECLGRVLTAVKEMGGIAVITSDHGDIEQMIEYETGKPHTAHTTNFVPFIVTQKGITLRSTGIFADIAPTLLDLMGIEKPAEMTGTSLIIR
ncbi:MAG: phosphoglycerate mutase (2,3-diphosphoglycerate-independent) [Nitrospirae bacterium]|nr:phosphoglycerate mutase (2,3-diphosphoglycerate-independent) [Nitrospirota bacterium]